MISEDIQKAINNAVEDARERRHYVTLEHLFRSLIEVDAVVDILEECNIDCDRLSEDLLIYLDSCKEMEEVDEVIPTTSFQRAVERAIIHVQATNQENVEGRDILMSLLQEENEHIEYIIEKQGVPVLEIIKFIAHGELSEERESNDEGADDMNADKSNAKPQDEMSFLEDVSKRCEEGKTDPLIGREKELSRMMQTLCRRRKNNPILVGESGVGKTALAEGFAQKILDGNVPAPLKDMRVFELSMGSMLAGTRYRGDFEERFKKVLQLFKDNPNYVVFIDEIHTLVGAGSTQGSAMDASNILKPALSNGEIRCIGATTNDEFRNSFEKDKALVRRFQKIDIQEPSQSDTMKILKGLRPKLEAFHDVKYLHSALEASVLLSDKYINGRYLPDKAIDILDEAGAKSRLDGKRRKTLNQKDIKQVISSMSNLPLIDIDKSEIEKLRHLESNLKRVIYGQDNAISSLVKTFLRHKAHLSDDSKPMGSFLLVGPTGVGKTELSIQLAKMLGVNYQRFDMSEYMERHSVSKLIGAPPGYIGHDNGGLLTEKINRFPHCVLLLDEIEKAHPDILNILLQIMDYGKLTDANGRETDFRHVVILMTSNVGTDNFEKNTLGFVDNPTTNDVPEAVKKYFSAEFRNRLNDIIRFNPLSINLMDRIVDKFTFQLEDKLKQKGYSLKLTKSAKAQLTKDGFSPALGARPLKRLIEEKLHQPIAEQILFNELEKGTEFVISWSAKNQHYDVKINTPQLLPA